MEDGLTAKQWIAVHWDKLEPELEGVRVTRRIEAKLNVFKDIMNMAIAEKEMTGLVTQNAQALADIINGR